MAKESYIDLKLPSIMGMGAVGPTLAIITATLYSALCVSMANPPAWGYPVIMLVLSILLAVFPVVKTPYPNWQRFCLWPVTAAIIFSTAWGTNHGLSMGEEALSQTDVDLSWSDLSLVSTAYADTNSVSLKPPSTPILNQIDFSQVDYGTKTKADQELFKGVGKTVWGIRWLKSNEIFLKDDRGVWYRYLMKTKVPTSHDKLDSPSQQAQRPPRGGFFKRF